MSTIIHTSLPNDIASLKQLAIDVENFAELIGLEMKEVFNRGHTKSTYEKYRSLSRGEGVRRTGSSTSESTLGSHKGR